MKYLTFAVLLVFQTPFVLAQTCQDEVQMLKWVENADPAKDAEKAIKSGNTKLIAVYGFALYFPGVDENQVTKAYETGDYILIEGTGDDLCSEEHARLNNIANEYAETYNKTISGKQ
ncbi:MAG: hypothetical protein KZQ93_03745 [Candidatus Thiodiazotropha sp. (ex Monitilora ramsayi)]|nr:hypothetical protein [Candidatus Thiodiazotropha sp. (ex Monitilora ramsayi)]